PGPVPDRAAEVAGRRAADRRNTGRGRRLGGPVAKAVCRTPSQRFGARPVTDWRPRRSPVDGRSHRRRAPRHPARAPGRVGGAGLHLRAIRQRHRNLADDVRPPGPSARRGGQGSRMTVTTPAATPRFSPGAIVRARGRDWIVLPGSVGDVLRLRPLSGSEEDAALIHLGVEPDVAPATFPRPTPAMEAGQEAALLLRDALVLSLRRGAGPFRSFGNLA